MFIYNIKFNFKKLLIIFSIVLMALFIFATYKIFSNVSFGDFKIKDKEDIKTAPINVTSDNYTDILKIVYDNTNTYIGTKVSITGYVYRNPDFSKDQFVIARTMISEDNQKFVVGFLCSYKDANKFIDNEWVNITGTISKANYNGEIPLIKITNINKVEKPSDEFVTQPNGSYI